MPTYVYETVPTDATAPERFEIRQGMNDAPLDEHPEHRIPIRRVISGGMGIVASSDRAMPVAGPGCGPGNCGCGRF
ncbi:MAG: zinc ribbon domain-containing protein [Gemmatimonadetes bacterium]|nr:zinc ribbon domain-containing protein [Gemmatimonadota bacterium]